VNAPELTRKASEEPTYARVGPVRFACDACRMVLLSTEELCEVSREQLEAVLKLEGRIPLQGELNRHAMLRERWALAVRWRNACLGSPA